MIGPGLGSIYSSCTLSCRMLPEKTHRTRPAGLTLRFDHKPPMGWALGTARKPCPALRPRPALLCSASKRQTFSKASVSRLFLVIYTRFSPENHVA